MKVSVYIAVSLDGFIAREDGALDWLPASGGEEDYGYNAFMASVDVLVMGRNTFDMVLSFGQWPYTGKRVIILTHRVLPDKLPSAVEWRSVSPSVLVEELMNQGAKHVYVDGGNTIQSFLNAGALNELIITRIPVLIGSGIPLFGPLSKDIPLKHGETRVFSNGFVQSRYLTEF